MTSKKLSKAKLSTADILLPPNNKNYDNDKRNKWLNESINNFVTTSPSNKEIYKRFLEIFWPLNHGLPGPVLDEREIREEINKLKNKPYQDVFRRLRELQGEEGFTGIIKNGRKYQLQNLTVSPKKIPRTHLSKEKWNKLLENYDSKCPICGAKNSDIDFQQDHKIPRSRGGTDADDNWQPLCKNCNNLKSITCRGCAFECKTCAWAHPQLYRPIRLSPDLTSKINQISDRTKETPQSLLEKIFNERMNEAFNRLIDTD